MVSYLSYQAQLRMAVLWRDKVERQNCGNRRYDIDITLVMSAGRLF